MVWSAHKSIVFARLINMNDAYRGLFFCIGGLWLFNNPWIMDLLNQMIITSPPYSAQLVLKLITSQNATLWFGWFRKPVPLSTITPCRNLGLVDPLTLRSIFWCVMRNKQLNWMICTDLSHRSQLPTPSWWANNKVLVFCQNHNLRCLDFLKNPPNYMDFTLKQTMTLPWPTT